MRRSPVNPILTREDVPDVPPLVRDVSSVFNPGAARWKGRDLLLLRVQTRGRETLWMPAWSDDRARFTVEPRIVTVDGLDQVGEPVHHAYDPRVTVLDDELIVQAAASCGAVVTVEEHQVNGGLGEAVASLLAREQPTPMALLGMQGEFGQSATAAELLAGMRDRLHGNVKFCFQPAEEGPGGAEPMIEAGNRVALLMADSYLSRCWEVQCRRAYSKSCCVSTSM